MEAAPRSGGPADVDRLSAQVRATAEKLRKRAEDAASRNGTQASTAMLLSVDQLLQAADLLQLQQTQLAAQAPRSGAMSSMHMSSTIRHLVQVANMLDKKSDEMKAKQAMGPANALATSASHVRTGVDALERIHTWIHDQLGEAMTVDLDIIAALEQISGHGTSAPEVDVAAYVASAIEQEQVKYAADIGVLQAQLDVQVAVAQAYKQKLDDTLEAADAEREDLSARVAANESAHAAAVRELELAHAAACSAQATQCESLVAERDATRAEIESLTSELRAKEDSARDDAHAHEAALQALRDDLVSLQATAATTDASWRQQLDAQAAVLAAASEASSERPSQQDAEQKLMDLTVSVASLQAALDEARYEQDDVAAKLAAALETLALKEERLSDLEATLAATASPYVDEVGPPQVDDSLQHELAATLGRVTELQMDVQALAAQLAALEATNADLQSRLDEANAAESAAATLRAESDELRAAVQSAESLQSASEARVATLEAVMARQAADMEARVATLEATIASQAADADAQLADICAQRDAAVTAHNTLQADLEAARVDLRTVSEKAASLQQQVVALEAQQVSTDVQAELIEARAQLSTALEAHFVLSASEAALQLELQVAREELHRATSSMASLQLQVDAHQTSEQTHAVELQRAAAVEAQLRSEIDTVRAELAARDTTCARLVERQRSVDAQLLQLKAQAQAAGADWHLEKAAVTKLLHNWQSDLREKCDVVLSQVVAGDAGATDLQTLQAAFDQYKTRAGAALKKAEKRAALLNPMRSANEALSTRVADLDAQLRDQQERVEAAHMAVEEMTMRMSSLNDLAAAVEQAASAQTALAAKEADIEGLRCEVAASAAQLDLAETVVAEKDKFLSSLREQIRELQHALEAAEATHAVALAAKDAAIDAAVGARDAILAEAKVGKAALETKLSVQAAAYDERIELIHHDYAQQQEAKKAPDVPDDTKVALKEADELRRATDALEALHADEILGLQATLHAEKERVAALTNRISQLEASLDERGKTTQALGQDPKPRSIEVALAPSDTPPVSFPSFGPPSNPNPAAASSDVEILRAKVLAHENTIASLQETLTEKLQQLAALKQPKHVTVLEDLQRVVDEERDAVAQRQGWHHQQMTSLTDAAHAWLESARAQFALHEEIQLSLEKRESPPTPDVAAIASDVMEPGLIFKSGVVVKAGANFSLPVVCTVGTVVDWTFRIDEVGGDVDFYLRFVSDDGSRREVQPLDRVEKLSGAFTVDAPGTLTFSWDNSFSWLNEKTLDYHVAVLERVDVATQAHRRQVAASDAELASLRDHLALLTKEEAVMANLLAFQATAAPLLQNLELCLEECSAHREMVVCPKLEQVQARMEALKAMISLYVAEQHTLSESSATLHELAAEIRSEQSDVCTTHSLWANRVTTSDVVRAEIQAAEAQRAPH
ncbi:hypothetical protein SDRG_06790 [Saprolegnia diclina VS20]|uniref:GOLD domain-containing protein n=1 Tax=Saprolegnia diclina (strain VS20) TaxID=1156394 RepID=T0RUE6_SAPDV|nr:hypothetical protein SDRG_06790 [Saprolegnia diclina VS20]EQC36053.1 hypothetical protein SDRG_06790 [Saprolegnia diclina VS20]|eukprot:XP_008610815.1 hypothetical protein SDRG_06790 [Saprolegnia diclina VS20]